MSSIKSISSANGGTTTNGNGGTQQRPSSTGIKPLSFAHLNHGAKYQRSASSPPVQATSPASLSGPATQHGASSSGHSTPRSGLKSPKSPLVSTADSDDPLLRKSSFDQLRDCLNDYEFDGEVIIKQDVPEQDIERYEDDDDEEDDDDDNYTDENEPGADESADSQNDVSNESIQESEEEELLRVSGGALPPLSPTRPYSYTVDSGSPSKSRLDRTESTIIHPDKNASSKVNNPTSSNGSPSRRMVPSMTINRADQFKEAISSEYQKMVDNPDEFRQQKLKQRKTAPKKDFSFKPSSGTQMKSQFYKQFIESKSQSIHDNVDKYKTDLLKNYITELQTSRNSGPITFNNLKPKTKEVQPMKDKIKALQRQRSYSQPVEMNTIKPVGMMLEAIIARENSRDGTNRKIPLLVTKCIDFLFKDSVLDTEGLFRVGGNQSEMETLMKSLLQHGFDIPSDCCIHVVSSVLKKFLRQLANPVFTFKYHHDFIATLKLQDDQRSPAIKKLLSTLPECNQQLIKELMRFLFDVTKHSSANMMHAHNLGLMFGPSLMKAPDENEATIMYDTGSSQVITHLLEDYANIFDSV
ncbi:hypothetical protein SAMD00019534_000680 [Acytostelium subglobosum LB1]|uniref:hypothetical protein n=1 Tax=Acytostelium subglobosum LB1 TaxID=1410327 RepID=UPI0006447B67|nr:hypothetical protein SAMD00019534_000680 [Acytostelium subglobosum LB1]GAM16893.1 hypothetical protein SAMD00019534_000680 [Acytostelium subglobosum LB1]|eukprot:XP_012758955.1 hypothetical protein SAMD00019534_000680 [Acytostelium subglobosum LB1]